ncbi:MAG: hypothetical protein Q9175_007113 [Cornicularia normoerica]
MGHNVGYKFISNKTGSETAMLRAAGAISAQIIEHLSPHVEPGVTIKQLNKSAHDLIPKSTAKISPATTPASPSPTDEIDFNDEATDIPLRKGTVFGTDVSIKKEGWCGDTARQWVVEDDTSSEARWFLAAVYQAMCLGISLVRPGVKVQEMAETVQTYV